jgi:hypothetical protein
MCCIQSYRRDGAGRMLYTFLYKNGIPTAYDFRQSGKRLARSYGRLAMG